MKKTLGEYIREADYPENIYADLAAKPGSPTWLLTTRIKRLDAIVAKLRDNAYAPVIKVFGSAAEDDGKIPNDIDIFIDTRGFKLGKKIAITAFNEILELSRQYRGLLHPYILINGKLYTKDNESQRWIKADRSGETAAVGKRGLPLTLFDKNFSSIAYRAISEDTAGSTIMDYVSKVEASRNATRSFCGYEISTKLFEHYSEWEIALMLGGY
jgi:predicted nucleotidyltransferase